MTGRLVISLLKLCNTLCSAALVHNCAALVHSFIRWRHRAYSTVVQLFRKPSHIIIMYFCPQTRTP